MACAPANPPLNQKITITPDAGGLSVGTSGLRMDFGRSPEGVISVLDRVLGGHKVLERTNCSADVKQNLRWGELVLTFTGERFVGWRQGGLVQGMACPV